jgi:hypothetical protein
MNKPICRDKRPTASDYILRLGVICFISLLICTVIATFLNWTLNLSGAYATAVSVILFVLLIGFVLCGLILWVKNIVQLIRLWKRRKIETNLRISLFTLALPIMSGYLLSLFWKDED